MKSRVIVTAIISLTMLVSCDPARNFPQRADNFVLVFEDTPCGLTPMNILDSASQTLRHTPIGDSTSITISFPLTNDELESIYQKAMSIDFFAYPSEFIIPDEQVIGFHSPASTYKLSLTNGEMSHSVTWYDDTLTEPSYKEATQLRELMSLIEDIIQAHPEFKQLPGAKAGCA